MSSSKFLEELKKDLDNDLKFNSEVANKIKELNKQADKYSLKTVSDYENLEERVNSRVDNENIKHVNPEDVSKNERTVTMFFDKKMSETKSLNKMREIFYLYDTLKAKKEELKSKILKFDDDLKLLDEINDDDIKKMIVNYLKIKDVIISE
jgi:hypothetical protein